MKPESHGLMARIGHGSECYPGWASRDIIDIDCRAVACKLNVDGKCSVPSVCEIGDNGSCVGFIARELKTKVDGD